MAESWIRVHANVADKPVVWRAMEALGVRQPEAVGLLVTFWGAVSQHAPNGLIAHLPDAQLESWAGWRGKKGRFAAFIRAKHVDADGRVNEWDDYAGALEDERERAREKKRKQREKRREKMGLSPECPRGQEGDVPGPVPGTSLPTRRDETRRDDTEQLPAAAREPKVLGVDGPPLTETRDDLVRRLGDRAGPVVDDFLGAAPPANRYAWARGLVAMLDPLGGRSVDADVLLLAMQDFLVADRARWPFAGRVFRAFVDDVKRPKAERTYPHPSQDATADALAKWAADTDAREKAHA